MSSRLARFALLFTLGRAAALGQGCAATADLATTGEDAITTDALASKKELFEQEMLFVRNALASVL